MDPVHEGAMAQVRPVFGRPYWGVVQHMQGAAFCLIWDGARTRLEPTASIVALQGAGGRDARDQARSQDGSDAGESRDARDSRTNKPDRSRDT